MAQRLLLVRHARVAAGHVGQLIGATDVPLILQAKPRQELWPIA